MNVNSILNKCLIQRENSYFLCCGNYYQQEVFQIMHLLNSPNRCSILSNALFDLLSKTISEIDQCHFISISINGTKMLRVLVNEKRIKEENAHALDHYYIFPQEEKFEKIPDTKNYILLCDVISTGFLVNALQEKLKNKNCELIMVGAILNCLTKEMQYPKLTYLHKYYIPKISPAIMWGKTQVGKTQIQISRINPLTNSIITENSNNANDNSIIIQDNQEFLDLINNDCLKIGFFKFNSNIHSYFIDMNKILSNSAIAKQLLKRIFNDVNFPNVNDVNVLFYPQNSAIKYINPDFIKSELLNNNELKIFEIERILTSEGWKFLKPHESITQYCKHKKVFVLDDSSSSGGSIIQIIDILATMQIAELVMLGIVAKINDQKKNFFSKIRTIEGGNTIKINIVFGSHWHIPVFFVDNSPLRHEKEWLKEVGSFSNLPLKIKKIANRVLLELEAKEIDELGSAFVIKTKEGTIPIKDLIMTRERVGKISNFTFQNNDFDVFQKIVQNYYFSNSHEESYKEIELLCAVFIHEPPLLKNIRFTAPDILKVMQDFVGRILFGQSGFLNDHPIKRKNLYYEWSGQNLLHVFFLCFEASQLVSILNAKRLNYIIKSFCETEPEVNYLLYRMLRYFPINAKDNYEKNMAGKFRKILGAVSDDFEENNDMMKNSFGNLKIFLAFISSLPYEHEDYNSAVNQLSHYYRKVVNDQYHNEYIYNDKIIITSQLNVVENEVRKMREAGFVKEINEKLPLNTYAKFSPKIANSLKIIYKRWNSIEVFINELQRFNITFPGFIIPIPTRDQDEFNMERLGELIRDISFLIYSSHLFDIQKLKELMDILFSGYIMGNSTYSILFQETTTRNLREEFDDFEKTLKERYQKISIQSFPKQSDSNKKNVINFIKPRRIHLDFPKMYLREIVFKEILDNLRHADFNKPVYISWKEDLEFIDFTIANSIERNEKKGRGGTGIGRLMKLNSFPVPTKYKRNIIEFTYIQIFTFKKI